MSARKRKPRASFWLDALGRVLLHPDGRRVSLALTAHAGEREELLVVTIVDEEGDETTRVERGADLLARAAARWNDAVDEGFRETVSADEPQRCLEAWAQVWRDDAGLDAAALVARLLERTDVAQHVAAIRSAGEVSSRVRKAPSELLLLLLRAREPSAAAADELARRIAADELDGSEACEVVPWFLACLHRPSDEVAPLAMAQALQRLPLSEAQETALIALGRDGSAEQRDAALLVVGTKRELARSLLAAWEPIAASVAAEARVDVLLDACARGASPEALTFLMLLRPRALASTYRDDFFRALVPVTAALCGPGHAAMLLEALRPHRAVLAGMWVICGHLVTACRHAPGALADEWLRWLATQVLSPRDEDQVRHLVRSS